ncbi:MAG: hypothetical protein DVB25_01175 [Verrucomicrobia bacterium]|nr:MAG: hypothetical protein DVB25_01175 [Verrucomicrobiota bacterium]
MHSIIRPGLLLLLVLTGLQAAELPKKAPLSRYTELWTKSPFTAPPKPVEDGPVVNPFADWALKGIAPIAGGYLITLINKKNPAEAVPPIDTDQSSEYQVLRIERNPDKPLGTVVYLSKGAITGSVTFDEKLSAPKPSVAKAPPKMPGQPQMPGQAVPPAAPQVPAPAVLQPRPRVVPPPTTGAQPGAQPGGRSGGRNYQRPSGR